MTGWRRITLAVIAIFVSLGSASAPPPRLLTANFRGGCHSYGIVVTGEGLDQPDPVVSYNITLTPASRGQPLIITDSFAVHPEKDAHFHKSVRASWKKFGFTPEGDFRLSGTAILISNLTPLHTRTIVFSRAALTCGQRTSPPSK